MMIIKSMIEPANPHLQCLLENNEEDYYFGISGGTQEEVETNHTKS